MGLLIDGQGHWRDRSIRDTNTAFDDWLHHVPDLAGEWVAAGWDLHDAFVWQRAGFAPAAVGAWSSVIDNRQLLDPEDELEPGDWYSPIALVADLAQNCAKCGFTPEDYDSMTAVSTDPRRAREWVDAGFTLQEATDWQFTITARDAADASAWRSANWDAIHVADLEAALVQVIGPAQFRTGGHILLAVTAVIWRNVGLASGRTITGVRAGLSASEAAVMTWDQHTTSAVEALAELLAP